LEACLNRFIVTEAEILHIERALERLENNEGYTEEEYFNIRARILERKQDLEEDIETVWSKCEETFGRLIKLVHSYGKNRK